MKKFLTGLNWGCRELRRQISTKLYDRYVTGYCMNEQCKELIYVIDGAGTLNKENEIIEFEKGDAILIDKKEKYYWNANCTIIMPCTPAWYPEQYKLIYKD